MGRIIPDIDHNLGMSNKFLHGKCDESEGFFFRESRVFTCGSKE